MKRKIVLMLAVVFACLCLTACGESAVEKNATPDDDAAGNSEEVEDNSGEAVTVEETHGIQVEPKETDDYGVMNLPLGMYLSVKEVKDGVVTLEIDNQSGYEMTYTADFALETEKDGQWESVPVQAGAAIVDVLYTIADLETQEYEIDLHAMYGELEAGHYRLSQEDMAAEFDIAQD